MLTRADDARAAETAVYLELQNRDRQKLEKEILIAALEQIEQKGLDADTCPAIVLGGQGWHPGVIGIVASRIVDRFHRPTILVCLNDNQGQGSGRSIAGFHLTKALEACGEFLESFGGHEMAAGVKLRAGNLDAFAQAFTHYARQTIDPATLQPELHLEASAQLQEFSSALVNDLSRLGPFGHANRRPIFCCPGLAVSAPPRRVGQNAQHLQLTVVQDGTRMRCIGFGLGDQAPNLPVGTGLDLAVEPIINQFNGRTSVELEIRDLRLL
jgi:single-stranded-DNA-specific exonuclease